jgi:hypothetical protein
MSTTTQTESLTVIQLDKLKHSLGLNYSKEAYRNYYNAGEPDQDLEPLVDLGYMKKADKGPEWGGIYYYITESGMELVKKFVGDFRMTR